ncbi:hypothetical protein B0H14DRAFT_2597372 [Mycena olivaceomarginata]|nr:hypothetical protein B0H14DRAFT_2597372 [Mycena olivaceomarginata]
MTDGFSFRRIVNAFPNPDELKSGLCWSNSPSIIVPNMHPCAPTCTLNVPSPWRPADKVSPEPKWVKSGWAVSTLALAATCSGSGRMDAVDALPTDPQPVIAQVAARGPAPRSRGRKLLPKGPEEMKAFNRPGILASEGSAPAHSLDDSGIKLALAGVFRARW